MKVQISKSDWIKATCNQKGKFWCPIDKQEFLLNVWSDSVKITVNATPIKKNKKIAKTRSLDDRPKFFYCDNCDKQFPLETANKIYGNDEVYYVCDKCVKSSYKI